MYVQYRATMSSPFQLLPPITRTSPRLVDDSSANFVADNEQFGLENANTDVTNAAADQSDMPQEDCSEDDDVTAEGATDEMPHFELTRIMHRLYATVSTGTSQDDTVGKSDAIKIQESCVDDLRFVKLCSLIFDESKSFASRLVHLGLVELCQQICVWYFSDRSRIRKKQTTQSVSLKIRDDEAAEEKKPDHLKTQLRLVLTSVVNLTDHSTDACQRVIDISFQKTLFGALRESLGPGVSSDISGWYNLGLADAIMSVLYNVVQVIPEARELYRDEHAVQVIQKYRTNTNTVVSCLAFILQSYVINAEENDLLGSAEQTFVFLADELRGAVLNNYHRSPEGYRASELLEATNKLSIIDSNKKRIIESGAVASYVQLLDAGDESHEIESAISSKTIVSEQFAAAQGLWTLASSCPDEVRNHEGCVDGLKKLLAVSANEGVRRQARGALDALGVAVKEQPSNTWNTTNNVLLDEISSNARHVFISYNHGSKPTCLRLRDRLRAAGFVVWIDADKIYKSIADDIINGLDQAGAVLICMSQKYYESPYCQKEVIYAAESLKDIIPLVLEPRYKPHGWLKFHVSDRLRYDFSRDEQFDESFPKLVSVLNNIFKSRITKLADKSERPDTVTEVSTTHSLPQSLGRPPLPPSDHQPPSSFEIPSVESTNGVTTWSREQVASWLETNGLLHLSNSIFEEFNGEMLLELKTLKSDLPETFAIFADHELRAGRLNTIDLLRLNRALRSLRSN